MHLENFCSFQPGPYSPCVRVCEIDEDSYFGSWSLVLIHSSNCKSSSFMYSGSSTLLKLGKYSAMTLKSMRQNSKLYSKTSSSALIRSQSWLLRFLSARRKILQVRDFRSRLGYTQTGTSEREEKCFACCCQRLVLAI